jgi:hypothetical protein
MLSQTATSADHLPAIQSVFLSRLLDIRTAPTHTPQAMLPRPIDLDVSMETIGLQPERSYWPPTAPTSPLFTEILGGVHLSGLNGGDGQDEHVTTGPNGRTPSHREDGNPNNLLGPCAFDHAVPALQQSQYDPNDPRTQDHQLPIPEVPTSSLALSLGSFVGDPSVRDVLFANDSFSSVRIGPRDHSRRPLIVVATCRMSILETQEYQ